MPRKRDLSEAEPAQFTAQVLLEGDEIVVLIENQLNGKFLRKILDDPEAQARSFEAMNTPYGSALANRIRTAMIRRIHVHN